MSPNLSIRSLEGRFERSGGVDLGAWLAPWLDLPGEPAGASLLDEAAPHYGFRSLDELAARTFPPLRVVVGPFRHRTRPTSPSPFARPAETSHWRVEAVDDAAYPSVDDPVDAARRQIAAARNTLAADRWTGELVFYGSGALLHLDELVAGLDGDPLRLFFSVPPSVLLRAAPRVEAALPTLAGRGHRIFVLQTPPRQLPTDAAERLGDGPSPEDYFAAESRLAAWQQRFPETLSFERRAGMGVTLFTPWTTLSELRESVELARRHALGDLFELTTSKLLLEPGTTAAERAEADDLLCEAFDPVVFGDHGASAALPDARDGLPWRFADAKAALVHRFAIRLAPPDGEHAPDDALYAITQALRRVLPEDKQRDPLWLLEMLVETAEESPAGVDADDYLDALLRRIDVPGAREEIDRTRAPRSEPPPNAHPEDARNATRIRAFVDGLDPAGRERFQGYELGTLDAGFNEEGHRVIDLALRRGEEELVLNLLPRGEVRGCFAMTSVYAICYHEDTPVDSREKELAVQALADVVDRALS